MPVEPGKRQGHGITSYHCGECHLNISTAKVKLQFIAAKDDSNRPGILLVLWFDDDHQLAVEIGPHHVHMLLGQFATVIDTYDYIVASG